MDDNITQQLEKEILLVFARQLFKDGFLHQDMFNKVKTKIEKS